MAAAVAVEVVVLSVGMGHDVGYLTGAVGGGREGYYTGAVTAGEPAGLWHGSGAAALGLSGEVDAELMEAVYTHGLDPRDEATASRSTWGEADRLGSPPRNYRSADQVYADLLAGRPDAGPEERAELRTRAEASVRKNVAFLDLTFNAQKSISVLGAAFEKAAEDARRAGDEEAAAQYAAHARVVEDAVMAGARAMIDYLEDVAGYTRVGKHGAGRTGRYADAHQWTAALFLQHDSRDRDPHLHVHGALLNKVEGPDGKWRTIDAASIFRHKAAAGQIGERVAEAYLAHALGVPVETRPDGKAREVVGISEEMREVFSSRRTRLTARAEELAAAFREKNGREPSPLERNRIAQQATLATRQAKSHQGETREQFLDRVERKARADVDTSLSQVVRDVLARAQDAGRADEWSERDVIARALATVGESRQVWVRADLLAAVSAALPGNLGIAPGRVRDLLEGLTDRALAEAVRLGADDDTADYPAELLLDDGTSAYVAPGSAMYAGEGQLAAERALRAAAVERGAVRFTEDDADRVVERFAASGAALGVDQAAAVRGVMTSGARVEVLSAAAGTGMSYTVGALAEVWQEAGKRVFGLAPSQVAAQVLAEEGVTATNTARWLGAQERLDRATVADSDEAWRLSDGDLVVVDEAGMTSTQHLSAIRERCEQVGAKLLLVGDARQLAAVGPGGALGDVAERGVRYELAEVRRFDADWEGRASLGLRDGNEAALAEYTKHGRLVAGGTVDQAEAGAARAWLADTIAGRESLLLVATNDQAARLSAELRAELVGLGLVEEDGVLLPAQGTTAGVGDLVQARRNGWELVGFEGNAEAPVNRQTFRVLDTREDGGLTVARVGDGGALVAEPLELAGSYVAEHVTLAYAATVHSSQGRTVDTAHAVIGAGTDAAGTYVALTRGRAGNTAWAVTRPTTPETEAGEARDVVEREPRAVLGDVLASRREQRSALREAEVAGEETQSTATILGRLLDEAAQATAGQTAATLDRLAVDGLLSNAQRASLAADEAMTSVEQLLRRAELAGHDPGRVLENAVAGRSLAGSRSPAQVLHFRIRSTLDDEALRPRVSGAADLIPRDVDQRWRPLLERRAEQVDDRRRELGGDVAERAPAWAVEALGPVPADPVERLEWEQRAGWAASYRELVGHDDEVDPLGSAPAGGVVEKRALYVRAHDELDLPDSGADVALMTAGQLRVRVEAYRREEAWAPRHVDDELGATTRAADAARRDAAVWAARAETAVDEVSRAELRADAERAQREAEQLDHQVADLTAADEARAQWFTHTAVTRDLADRSKAELHARGVDVDDVDDVDDRTTAGEWLDAHDSAQRDDEAVREVRESDVADVVDDDALSAPVPSTDVPVVETNVPDVRDTSTRDDRERETPDAQHDRGRVPSADEAAATVARAQAALAEMRARAEAEDRAARDAEVVARWAEPGPDELDHIDHRVYDEEYVVER